MPEELESARCPYCLGLRLQTTYAGLSHQLKPDHGPFSFLRCRDCGSGTTLPVPSEEQLRSLYAGFADGMDGALREIMEDRVESTFHELPVRRIRTLAGLSSDSRFVWHDVGAGAGEMAR